MRLFLPLLAVTIASTTVNAQTGVNEAVQKAMAGRGVQAEDDNSPFVPNTFIGSMRMEMHMFKGGTEDKHSPMNMRYAFTEDMTAMNMENPEDKSRTMRILYDLKNKAQFMLMDDGKGKKTALKQKMKKIVVDTDKQKGDAEMKFTVTDEYKDIDGHKCRKITGESADSKGEWWVAQDLDLDLMKVMSMVQTRGHAHDEFARFGGKGLPMEMTFEKKDGSDKMVMNTKDVVVGKPDPSFFDLTGYEVMDMTNMPGMGH